jgi:hypothetical protein
MLSRESNNFGVSTNRLCNTIDSWAMETIKYVMAGKMVVSGKTKMSMTEQRSLNNYAEGMSHYLQSIRSVQGGHG